MSQHSTRSSLAALTLGALGVVYGDIGTSPLYAFKEVFAHGHVPMSAANIHGVLSLMFWTLTVVVSLKYVLLILRADNKGEGGLIAMLALATHAVRDRPRLRRTLMVVGLFGTAVFYGDGVITPAISVLSAVEGLEVAAPKLHDWIIPLTLLVLTALFAVQRYGTSGIGRWFGPITLVWFGVLVALGLPHIASHPGVLVALNPVHAASFIAAQPLVAPSSFTGVHGLAVDKQGRLLAGSVVGNAIWEVDRTTGAVALQPAEVFDDGMHLAGIRGTRERVELHGTIFLPEQRRFFAHIVARRARQRVSYRSTLSHAASR